MSLNLYPHNKEAYDAAVKMLNERGKAAIVHPTGTGKSFIGFQLSLEHQDKKVCWLSPSSYIFKTQLENLKAVCEETPENIIFYSYAKLLLLENSELEAIQPDYIILDEFHRCGASMWGAGVRKFLELYPQVPVLGLSATSVRYLDNHRDMAEELFNGNVASEITLGEALVRGILNPPKYVISLFSYEEDVKRYETRIRNAQNVKVQKRAEKYLERLKRALEQAEGLDEIFQKHLPEKDGKYIVFCSNKEHARLMMERVPEWFGGIDKEPHLYYVYSKSIDSEKAFAEFKADNSEHLKLLFCIDMLNEGVHVEDIAGVILFRPTVSPIIYKQQIGRVMASGDKEKRVIIDVVGNISSLYSIGAIEEEMLETVDQFLWNGSEKQIVNESFTVIDEVKDCKALFDELEKILAPSWDVMYQKAEAFYRENGNLAVPSSYLTEEGYHLGSWLVTQRAIYRGSKTGNLTGAQIEKLSAIGMNWSPEKEQAWEKMFLHAMEYYKEFHHLDIPANYFTKDGAALGFWYRRNVSAYRKGSLSKERLERLESIGFKQESIKLRNWMKYYEAAAFYKETHGDLNIHADYVTETGLKLGAWLAEQRYSYGLGRLSEQRIALLEDIGIDWYRFDSKWMQGFEAFSNYVTSNGNANAASNYVTKDGFKLGIWLNNQRSQKDKGRLSKEKIKKLEELGMVWSVNDFVWEQSLQDLTEYQRLHGTQRIPKDYVSKSGIRLNSWVSNQRTGFRKGQLPQWKIEKLEKINFSFSVRGEAQKG